MKVMKVVLCSLSILLIAAVLTINTPTTVQAGSTIPTCQSPGQSCDDTHPCCAGYCDTNGSKTCVYSYLTNCLGVRVTLGQ